MFKIYRYFIEQLKDFDTLIFTMDYGNNKCNLFLKDKNINIANINNDFYISFGNKNKKNLKIEYNCMLHIDIIIAYIKDDPEFNFLAFDALYTHHGY